MLQNDVSENYKKRVNKNTFKARTLLERLPLLRNLEIDTISKSVSQCSFREIKKDQFQLTPQAENSSVYVMICGRLEVYLELDGESV